VTPILAKFRTAAAGMIRRTLGLSSDWFARGMEADEAGVGRLFTNPMRQSVWVMAAVRKVAGPISSVGLDFCGPDEQEVENPALDAFWQAPALDADGSRLGIADFLEASTAWLLLSGECFWVLDDSWKLPFPDVAEMGGFTPIMLVRPDRMRPLVRGGKLEGWEHTDVTTGTKTVLFMEQVIQVKQFNPYDPWRGLGAMQAAAVAAGADYASGVFAKNLAENNGDQGVMIVAKSGIPTDEQRAQIVAQLREKRALQQRGIFKPIFLSGDITVEDPRVRAVDAAFLGQRMAARQEIAAAFGVPASFFDPVASYSIGSASDRYVLIEETCKPIGAKLCGGISRVAARQVRMPVKAELDWDDHSTMQQVRRERLDAATKLWATGMPMQQVSDYLGLDLPEYPGWDVGYMPFGLTEVGTEPPEPTLNPAFNEAPLEAAPADEAPPATPAAVVESAFAGRKKARTQKIEKQPLVMACGCSIAEADLVRSERDPSEVAQWKASVAARLPVIKAYRVKFSKVLMEARAEVLHKLLTKAQPDAVVRADSPLDFLFNLNSFDTRLQAAIRGVTEHAIGAAAQQVGEELGRKDDPWKLPSQATQQFLKDRKNKLSNVGEEIFERVRGAVTEGVNAGDSRDAIAKRVRLVFNDIDVGRSKVIAQTETSAAFGFGRHEALKSAGIQYKRWLTSGNANVRRSHSAMNGEIVPLDEPFQVTCLEEKSKDYGSTDSVMHPGDAEGAPWNVINCHCVEVASAEAPSAVVESSGE
jgi:hypothetical protein